jgi:hypothetical protein
MAFKKNLKYMKIYRHIEYKNLFKLSDSMVCAYCYVATVSTVHVKQVRARDQTRAKFIISDHETSS